MQDKANYVKAVLMFTDYSYTEHRYMYMYVSFCSKVNIFKMTPIIIYN